MLDLGAEYAFMKADIDNAIATCLSHQRWILGPEVAELQEDVKEYLGAGNAIGCCSGTEALVLALRAIAIKTKGEEFFSPDDEVITTPFTFTATGDAILRSGATPVFVDIDPDTFNLSTKSVAGAITEKTVGMMPVHLYGQSSDMDAICEMAKEHGLFVVEDVAQAFGAKHKDRSLGTVGDAGAFSFFPSKNLGGFGDGGMCTTSDEELASIISMLIKHGGRDKYNVDHVGYNARLDTIQAAILLVKMKHIEDFTQKRRALAQMYDEGLRGIEGLTLPYVADNVYHVYHQYTLRTKSRDGLKGHLDEAGVSSMVYYPVPLHKMKVFEGRSRVLDCVEAEAASAQVLSIPMEPLQEEAVTARVVEAVRGFFKA